MSPSITAAALALLALKVTTILAGGLAATAALRRRSAAIRHAVCLVTLAGVLLVSILSPIVPRLTVDVPVPPSLVDATAVPVTPPTAVRSENAANPDRPPVASTPVTIGAQANGSVPQAPWNPRRMLVMVWALGAFLVVARSVLAHVALARLEQSSVPVEEGAWRSFANDDRLLQRVRLRLARGVRAPLTWGWRRPVIVFPLAAEHWPDDRRRAAILHELAHVARRDYLGQLVATCVCALYWFHPLAWIAARRLRHEGELACDDRALRDGALAPDYAAALLDVARISRDGLPEFAAVSMARRGHLEDRLLAVLDDTRPRNAVPRGAALLAAVAAVMLIPFAALSARLASPPTREAAASTSPTSPTPLAAAEPLAAPSKLAAPIKLAAPTKFAASAQPDSGEEPESKVLDRDVPAKPGETLTLDLDTGANVEIRGAEVSAVHVHLELGGKDWKDSRPTFERVSNGVRVRIDQTGDDYSSMSTSHRLQIRVPSRFDVRLRSAGGGIGISNVEGTFSGNTGGGEIVLDHVRGRARLTTGGGEIRVTDSHLAGSVTTGGGAIKLDGVSGGLTGSSGSGPVIHAGEEEKPIKEGADDGASAPHYDKAGGDIDLDEVPSGAKITTGGGDIHIGRGAGQVNARTGGGDVVIGPIAGSVKAGTGAGKVTVTLASVGGKPQSLDLWSGSGAMVIELPPDLDARFDIETAYTKSFGRAANIKSAFPLAVEPATDWSDDEGTPRRYVRATGVAGKGGGLIKIKTVNGDVEIRKRASQ
jgi:beta-lactamase regulating signal transducer with metallopeptidase domain